jgi:pantothenate kinase
MAAGRCDRPHDLEVALRWLRELLRAHAPRRVIVGLVGLPGAGKSTLAARLVAELENCAGPGMAVALGMDGFHLTRAQLARFPDPALALARRGAPWTFDAAALAERLRTLRAMPPPGDPVTTSIRWPDFAHDVGDPVPDALVVPSTARLVLIEGLYLLHRGDGWQLDGLLDACAYLDVGLEQALARVAQRHMASWGLDRDQAMARVQANDRLNAQLVAATRHRAHWLLPAHCAGL